MNSVSPSHPPSGLNSRLILDRVSVGYGSRIVLEDVSLTLAEGEIGCLLGPSGAGKTALLRAVAGFEPLHGGTASIDGCEIAAAFASLPPERRRVGMVFQDYALFPHLTVRGNVGFGLDRSRRSAARIDDLLELVGLADVAAVYPEALSGGQRQRTALARALAPRPAVLLLDEPFSNLDRRLRARLVDHVRRVLIEEGATALMATHDLREAFALGDKIGLIEGGALRQWKDAAAFAAEETATGLCGGMAGEGVFVDGVAVDRRAIAMPWGTMPARLPPGSAPGDRVRALMRADLVVAAPPDKG